MPFRVKRVYEEPKVTDGERVLVDRLWPRGLKKDVSKIDLWLKEIAPSDSLRKWFAHDPDKWQQFQQRYFRELDRRHETVRELLLHGQGKRVTLLFAAKDLDHNNAVALKAYLTRALASRRA